MVSRIKSAIVILNWNGKTFLEKFLPPLINSVDLYNDNYSKEGRAEIIIADNASSDDSIDFLKKNHPDIKTIVLDKNYGFTGGYNMALEQVDANYYILLNSDIEVTEDWLEHLCEWMDNHPSCGACSPKLLSYDNKDMFEYAGAAGGYIDKYGYPFCRGRVMKEVEKDFGQYDEPERVFWASGACIMIRSELYKKLGGLDNRFFAHMEEIDFCWRLQLLGYYVAIIPDSKVYHVGGGTLPTGSAWKLFLNFRNNLLMLSNNLAQTYSLEYYIEGYNEVEASKKGIKKAERLIFKRMILDGCSAIVYLITFKFDYFKEVLRAHSEYMNLKRSINSEEIIEFLEDRGKRTEVVGIYKKWIIPMAFIYGKKIFRKINMHMTYDL